uniref:Uncharacterized protein n=1 Tax=Pararge aegeria TaxID=116150 RepID=S4PDK1_9NEOP
MYHVFMSDYCHCSGLFHVITATVQHGVPAYLIRTKSHFRPVQILFHRTIIKFHISLRAFPTGDLKKIGCL